MEKKKFIDNMVILDYIKRYPMGVYLRQIKEHCESLFVNVSPFKIRKAVAELEASEYVERVNLTKVRVKNVKG